MTKQKLAIVSSYDELCGNASYTKALAEGLSVYFDVTVDRKSTRLNSSHERLSRMPSSA